MSRQNKVNKDSYTQAGRLTPDDMARERQKQRRPDQEKNSVVNKTSERKTDDEQAPTRARSAPGR